MHEIMFGISPVYVLEGTSSLKISAGELNAFVPNSRMSANHYTQYS
jgi:hypothetical protein